MRSSRAAWPASPNPPRPDAEPILARIRELQARKQELNKQASTFDVDQQQTLAARQIENYTAERNKAGDRRLQAVARLERLGKESADGIIERFARLRQQLRTTRKPAIRCISRRSRTGSPAPKTMPASAAPEKPNCIAT